MIERYPLQWPEGWPRTQYPEYSRFSTSLVSARNEVLDELQRLGASDYTISSNLQLLANGMIASRQPRLQDTGVAVYFTLDGEQKCIPSDKYVTAEDNLHAVALTIKALRGLERWGTGQIMKAAFRGFTALPETAGQGVPTVLTWFETLGLSANAPVEDIREAYRELAKTHHPDVGGDPVEFQKILRAYQEGLKARK